MWFAPKVVFLLHGFVRNVSTCIEQFFESPALWDCRSVRRCFLRWFSSVTFDTSLHNVLNVLSLGCCRSKVFLASICCELECTFKANVCVSMILCGAKYAVESRSSFAHRCERAVQVSKWYLVNRFFEVIRVSALDLRVPWIDWAVSRNAGEGE